MNCKRILESVNTSLGYGMFWKISYSCVLLLGPFPFQVILTVRATTEKGKLE
jgi:hypothetical protein